MAHMKKLVLALFIVLFANAFLTHAQIVDFSTAHIQVTKELKSPFRETYIRLIQEEIRKRTELNLRLQDQSDAMPVIALVFATDQNLHGIPLPQLPKNSPAFAKEGYAFSIDVSTKRPILWLIGGDERGILYSIGEFFRKARLSKNKILVDKKYEVAVSPLHTIRGHQLGYRNTANSWDAWDPKQYEQYIRDLALFGTNAKKIFPWRTVRSGLT